MGTMGSGKTTAARLLSQELKITLLEENFGENAFLPRFYQDMNRWAFHSQTFYLMEKVTQMLQTVKILEKKSVIQDTPIVQDVYSYAKAQHVLGHIDDAEWRLYLKIYKSFLDKIPEPDLIIYLETTPDVVMERIESRGRAFERKIPLSYVELLDMLNHKWLSENHAIKVIKSDAIKLNLARSHKDRIFFANEIKLVLKKLPNKKYGL